MVGYIGRLYYELERLEALAIGHRTWHTHTNKYASECWICCYLLLARILVRGIKSGNFSISETGVELDTTKDGQHRKQRRDQVAKVDRKPKGTRRDITG